LLFDPARIDPAAWLAERIGDVVILGDPAPVAAGLPLADPPPAEHDWLAALAAAVLPPLAPPAALIPLGSVPVDGLFIAAGIRAPPPAAADRHCTWITDTTGEAICCCGELILDGLDLCPAHRAQRAETLLGSPIRPPMPFGPFPTHAPMGNAA
jgi:hypothetical protein